MNPEDVQPQLDPQVTALLKTILEKDISALTESDKDFLRARKSYLGRSARKKFEFVFTEEKKEVEEVEESNEVKETDTSKHPGDSQSDDDGEDE